MTDDFKAAIAARNKNDNYGGFIKVGDSPLSNLSSDQKVALNRKGNVLFNSGDIEGAVRIFKTTGYSDGLTRAADKYMDKKMGVEALKLYVLAHNQKKADAVCEKLAGVISSLLKDENN